MSPITIKIMKDAITVNASIYVRKGSDWYDEAGNRVPNHLVPTFDMLLSIDGPLRKLFDNEEKTAGTAQG